MSGPPRAICASAAASEMASVIPKLHALPAGGAVHVGGVAGEQRRTAAATIQRYLGLA
ncbi:hypothetical protein MAV101_05220 [Mycobacterium avium subsp. hominissuis 101]|nr:hypothetical protein O984_16125 [Mycobacterium avium 05-4293]ETB07605.1 hypothetical protein P863_16215 [Mycobacterium avium subsp. silvaticum ATCC 49884]ETB14752.1 hypothetical protein O972_17215 [Mycobacterium avium subsp. avium 10-9275]ETB19402.1 hypothetical protein O973_16390 [Mycobacterium avium subsp. avium 11-4751]ETB22874.1 hypothetical protein O983_16565 [Mycobacterium avium 09-5983]ETZ44769.1 hypothetical protein L838_3211 [Mycobacterium avium MAV_120709_2344]ETZ46567.1 hypothet